VRSEHSNCLFKIPDENAHAFTLAPIRNNHRGTKNMAKAAVKAKKAPAKAAPAKQAPAKAAPAKKPVAKKPAGKKSAA
jgi:MetJ family transcriptional regulator, methionine regulon repressor